MALAVSTSALRLAAQCGGTQLVGIARRANHVARRAPPPAMYLSGCRYLSTQGGNATAFIETARSLCTPDNVHICSGTEEEFAALMQTVVDAGTAEPLNSKKRPGSYIVWTDPDDVKRAEKSTFICSEKESDAGPTNNWTDPTLKRLEMQELFKGCMEGRTMYVVPFSMGPMDSPMAKLGLEITDSAYVAASMRVMTRMGQEAWSRIEDGEDFVPCMHSVGQPLSEASAGSKDYELARSSWPCNIDRLNVCHFPESREIWSFGSGYGGNSLLGKKCFALRIASVQGRDEGWMAEHMLILGITNPAGKKRYMAAAFPSACGKTNLAMLSPTVPGWSVEVVGDDIAWMRPGDDGRLYAINPEFGFFGVAPGTSNDTNPHALATCESNSLFTNVGHTADGDVWWEGMTESPPAGGVRDWHRQDWTPGDAEKPCAQGNSRFTTPLKQCPVLDSEWNSPAGVPIDAIIFGGRRDDTVPLVFQSRSWAHGTFLGSLLRSNATGAADQEGTQNDPMAMKAFCGYNIKDYLQHWLSMGEKPGIKMPKVFQVNWFSLDKTDSKRKYIWPGFGDNIRILEWIFDRVDGTAQATSTPIGLIPTPESLNTEGLDLSDADMHSLLAVDRRLWAKELERMFAYYNVDLMEGDTTPVPQVLQNELAELRTRLRNP